MFKLILGRAGSGKTRLVLNRLCEAGRERPQVLLVPEQMSHETERALCAAGGPRINLRAEVLSFSRLANRIFQRAGGLGEEELEPGGRLLLMYRAVQGVAAQLKVYGRPSKRPAFLASLLATADELKSCRVLPELLVRAGEMGPMTPAELWAGKNSCDPLRGAWLDQWIAKTGWALEGISRARGERTTARRRALEEVRSGLIDMKKEWEAWQQ